MEHSQNLPDEVRKQLRRLCHDLSNSLETILQASYLLGKAELEPESKRWVEFIDKASRDAAQVNREIREILRTSR